MLFRNQQGDAGQAMRDRFTKATGSDRWNMAWPLPNMKPCTEAAFWGYRSSMGFQMEVYAGYKEILRKDGVTHGHAVILAYWADYAHWMDGGFAVAYVYSGLGDDKEVQYFEWRACEHDFQQKNIGNCLNRYTCTKCNRSYDVDSSG